MVGAGEIEPATSPFFKVFSPRDVATHRVSRLPASEDTVLVPSLLGAGGIEPPASAL